MFRIKNHILGLSFAIVAFFYGPAQLSAQAMPEVFDDGSLEEQFEYLQNRTLIYNNFRAIREDMFQEIKKNSLDSLNKTFGEINRLNQHIVQHQIEKDSIQQNLSNALAERDAAIEARDSLFLLGLPLSKSVYNVLLWSIIAALTLILIVTGILFKRANVIAGQKTKEMKELQLEFDEYRKASRERFEKQAIDHFNEVKRSKGL
jgi:preprotein translocase subunit SecF